MTTSFSREECISLLVDFLEVSVHQILRSRQLYPKEIFIESQKHGVLVHKCIHPEVNAYMSNILQTVRTLLEENFAEKFVMVLKNKDVPVEKFIFVFNSYFITTPSGKFALNVTEIQQQSRAIWLTISHRFGSELKSKENCTYTFEIHTKSAAYDNMLNRQSTNEDLQWIEVEKVGNPSSVVPIRRLDSQPFCIEVYKEDFGSDDDH